MQLPADGTRKFVFASVLCGIALALSLIDSAISSAIFPLPGFKLGLANIVSLFAIYTLGFSYAFLILVVRSLVTALLSGNVTMLFFSLAAGAASIVVMWLLVGRLSIIKTSVTGSVCHNAVQVAVAMVITSTPQVAYYMPILIAAGTLSGFAMGALCTLIIRRLKIPTIQHPWRIT